MKPENKSRARAFWIGVIVLLFVSQGAVWAAAIALTSGDGRPLPSEADAP